MNWIDWIEENGVSQESVWYNSIPYLFVTLKDGWIAIFEKDLGQYIPCIQADNREHAVSWCVMREPLRIPIERLC